MNENFLISALVNNDSNVFPLFSIEDEDLLKDKDTPDMLPVLPIRNMVLFPGVILPISVGRNKAIRLAQDYARTEKPIGVITQKENDVEEPTLKDMFPVGTIARIIQSLNMPDGSVTIVVQGLKRFHLDELTQTEPYYKGRISDYPTNEFDPDITSTEDFNALIGTIRDTAVSMVKMSQHIPHEAAFALKNIEAPIFLLHYIASQLSVSVNERQAILEQQNVEERAKTILTLLNKDLQLLELKNQIQHKSKQEMDKQQREYFLHEQMKTIQQELGGSPSEKAVDNLKKSVTNDAAAAVIRSISTNILLAEYDEAEALIESLLREVM